MIESAIYYAMIFCLDAACLSGPMVRFPMTHGQCVAVVENVHEGVCVRLGRFEEDSVGVI